MLGITGSVAEITLRSLCSVIVLFFLAKLVGPRQIAQLTFYDYIIGISVGSIAAAVAIDKELPLILSLWAMFIYIGISYLLAWGAMKNMRIRRFFSGTPQILIYKGKIIEKNMRSQNLDISELLCACRTKGFFNLNDLDYVIMENNGNLSFLPNSAKAPLTPADMAIKTQPNLLFADVIIDGHIMKNNLDAIKKSPEWLNLQLQQQKCTLNEILLAISNEEGELHIYRRNQSVQGVNLFD